MLIRFSVENWMSFREQASFSMIASRERQHGDRVPQLGKYQTRILPVAAIYGGNASGKTNMFKAINFAKMFIVKGTQPESLIAIEPFRLDTNFEKQPSRFCFEIYTDDNIFEFSFAVTRNAVIEEKLVQITGTSEKVLYNRENDKPNFDSSLLGNKFLEFAFQGTRENQLFLTNSVSQKVNNFKPIYDWFKNSLVLIAPDSRFGAIEQLITEEHPLNTSINAILSKLDTGIAHLGGEEISIDVIALPQNFKTKLQEEVKENTTARISVDSGDERYIITRRGGELIAKKLVTYHQRGDGADVKFEMQQESDGSRRVIDLLPAFLEVAASKSTKVFIIDEIDRSLHTLLTRRLLEAYLASCSHDSRAQLLFTTHDVLLMDQLLLRRDEMWVCERDVSGNTTIVSFSEFKDVRYDKDIRKSYLQGRFGGVPHMLLGDVLGMQACDRDKRSDGQ